MVTGRKGGTAEGLPEKRPLKILGLSKYSNLLNFENLADSTYERFDT